MQKIERKTTTFLFVFLLLILSSFLCLSGLSFNKKQEVFANSIIEPIYEVKNQSNKYFVTRKVGEDKTTLRPSNTIMEALSYIDTDLLNNYAEVETCNINFSGTQVAFNETLILSSGKYFITGAINGQILISGATDVTLDATIEQLNSNEDLIKVNSVNTVNLTISGGEYICNNGNLINCLSNTNLIIEGATFAGSNFTIDLGETSTLTIKGTNNFESNGSVPNICTSTTIMVEEGFSSNNILYIQHKHEANNVIVLSGITQSNKIMFSLLSNTNSFSLINGNYVISGSIFVTYWKDRTKTEFYERRTYQSGEGLIEYNNIPVKDGYIFDKWVYEKFDETSIEILPETVTYDINIYPIFYKNVRIVFEKTTDISLTVIGNVPAESIVSSSTIFTLPNSIGLTLPGYNFMGWHCSYDENQYLSAQQFEVPEVEEITFTAMWQEISYTLDFVMNGHGTQISQRTFNYMDSLAVESPTEVGYTFVGWYENSSCEGEVFNFISMPNKNVVLYALWQANEYTINFNMGEMEKDEVPPYFESINLEYGRTLARPENPTRTHHNFVDWYTDENCLGLPYDFSTLISNNLALYAKWENKEYFVTFVTGHGVENSTFKQNSLTYITQPQQPSTTGYTFINWFLSNDNGVTLSTQFDFNYTKLEGDIVLYAKWEVNSHTAFFYNEDGSTLIQSNSFNYGNNIIAPTTPIKQSNQTYTYAFLKWVLVEDETEILLQTTTMPDYDVSYKAVFNEEYKRYTIRFISPEGFVYKEKDNYIFGEEIKLPTSNPVKQDDNTYTYNFVGWIDFVLNSTVTENRDYIAQFSASYINYTINFLDALGNIYSSGTYHYNDVVLVPQNGPTKEQTEYYTYTFAGWLDLTEGFLVKEDKNFIPTYNQFDRYYVIKFFDANNNEYSVKQYKYGQVIERPNTNPQKQQDNTYTYSFVGWEGFAPNSTVNQNTDYYPQFAPTYINYTIRFLNEDSSVFVEKSIYHYDDVIALPNETPQKEQDNTYTYSFSAWNNYTANEKVTGNKDFFPIFTPIYINYIICFYDEDGTTVLESLSKHFGDSIVSPIPPEKEGYHFVAWSQQVVNVEGNTNYTAVYQQNIQEELNNASINNGKNNNTGIVLGITLGSVGIASIGGFVFFKLKVIKSPKNIQGKSLKKK